MCLAIPGIVISIDTSIPELKMARVDFGGVIKNICIEWTDAEVGEYVLAHAGVALCKVDTQEALRSIKAFHQIIDNLEHPALLRES
ncbi:MAG: HypC/HybG/HupF family hydrogenase formation chaperone [Bacteroidales bacterium]